MRDFDHPALARDAIAVITGAALGIGREMSMRLARRGVRVWMIDTDASQLDAAAEAASAEGGGEVRPVVADVADADAMFELAAQVQGEMGPVDLLMNNAVIRDTARTWERLDIWKHMMAVNYWGVVHGVHAFVPAMIEAGGRRMVVNVGSKQGITNPPGKPPYNVPKAAIKSYTELLAHDLRNTPGCELTAHLLIPGFTTTGTREHVEGAWLPSELVDYTLPRLAAGDFYILCPDGEVTPEMDARRMAWATADIIENRPALSRWHPDWKDAFVER